MKVKEKSEKAGLKLNVNKTKIIGLQSHHFVSNRRGKVGTVADFIIGVALNTQCIFFISNIRAQTGLSFLTPK